MLCVLERFSLRDTVAFRGGFNIAEDRSLDPVVVPLETDTVSITRDDEVVDLPQRSKLVKALSANAKAIVKRTGQQMRFSPS